MTNYSSSILYLSIWTGFASCCYLFNPFFCKWVCTKIIVFKGENIVIGQNTSILEDSTQRLGIQAVSRSSGFTRSRSDVPNLQLSHSDFWLRFVIKNESSGNQLLLNLEYPTLSICELHFPVNGVYETIRLSDKESFGKRKYKHQDFLFDIRIARDSIATFYLKVHSNEQMVLPLVLGTPQKIAKSKLTHDLLWGGLIGLLLVMVLYNSFVFISTRDISYLYYVSYTLPPRKFDKALKAFNLTIEGFSFFRLRTVSYGNSYHSGE